MMHTMVLRDNERKVTGMDTTTVVVAFTNGVTTAFDLAGDREQVVAEVFDRLRARASDVPVSVTFVWRD